MPDPSPGFASRGARLSTKRSEMKEPFSYYINKFIEFSPDKSGSE
jgi:hypothetical protein